MTAPAGWYPEGNGQRYWDGTQWTDSRAPYSPARPWSGLAHAAFWCGIGSLVVWFFLPLAIVLATVAVVFMFVGLRDIRKRHARGSVLAVFGGVFGFLTLQLAAFLIITSGMS